MQYKSQIVDFILYKNGEQGTPGEPGADGRTQYLHIKYSDDGETFTDNNGETLGAWIGTLVDFEEIDSTTFEDYTWKKFTEDVDEELTVIRTSIAENAGSIKLLSETVVYSDDFESYKTSAAAELLVLSNSISTKVETTDFENYKTTASTEVSNQIALCVKEETMTGDYVIGLINLDATTATIKAKYITLEGLVTANEYFKILSDGSIEAVNGSFKGHIEADTGSIGGWIIEDDRMYSESSSKTYTKIQSANVWTYAFVAGSTNLDDSTGAKFLVKHTGELYASEATISGEINAMTGEIGGFEISESALTGTNIELCTYIEEEYWAGGYLALGGSIHGDIQTIVCGGGFFIENKADDQKFLGIEIATFCTSDDNASDYISTSIQMRRKNQETAEYEDTIIMYGGFGTIQCKGISLENIELKNGSITSEDIYYDGYMHVIKGISSSDYIRCAGELRVSGNAYFKGHINAQDNIYMRPGYSIRGSVNDTADPTEENSYVIAYIDGDDSDNIILGHAENGAATEIRSGKGLYLRCWGDTSDDDSYKSIVFTCDSPYGYFRPTTSDVVNLGSSYRLFRNVYATNGTINTSDANKKTNIKTLADQYVEMLDLLEAKTNMLLSGDRIHVSFIAQEVEAAMNQVGLAATDFAGFCKDIDENGGETYGLRYHEFVPILHEKIRRVEKSKNEAIAELKLQIALLTEQISNLTNQQQLAQ